MPFTHVEIEERKTRNLSLLLAALVFLHTVSVIVLVIGVRLFLGLPWQVSGWQVAAMFVVALLAAMAHWSLAIPRLVERVLLAVLARPLDAGDTYHDRLRRIIEEVTVATGGRRQIEAYVIPTYAMNACAVADFSGRSAIAVTEGLLSRLNRAQLEAVVGHEAAHIACGDSLSNSAFCGLFGLHEEGLKRLSGLFTSRGGSRLLRGRAGALVLFVMAVLWLTNKAKRFCELAISRQQEYRADAVAVRLTRNPLSLAEALRLISRHWRGVGAQGESLANIFIMDPGTDSLSEQDGLLPDLFSTHPPTERRIELLLGMAHVDPGRFEEELSASVTRKHAARSPSPSPVATASSQWLIWKDGQWCGPLGVEAIAQSTGLSPESWVRRLGEESATPASHDAQLLAILRSRYASAQESPSRMECPHCRIPLVAMTYEGAPIERCPACQGCSVDFRTAQKVLYRQEYDFPEAIKRLGESLLSVEGRSRLPNGMPPVPINRRCSQCGAAVVRKFYTEAYPVEVEQCWACGLAWLDAQELELLQYLYEKQKRPLIFG
jgi:heat shock protein HtpX